MACGMCRGGMRGVGRWMLRIESPGRRKRRSKRRFMEAVREDMVVGGVTKEDAENRMR